MDKPLSDGVNGYLTDAMKRIAKAYNRRLEREAVAAYMAGFEVLDVLTPHDPYTQNDDHTPALRAAFLPREYANTTPVRMDEYATKRYDLRELTPDDAAEARRRWRAEDG